MTRIGQSIEPITFPTQSRYATCYATDAGLKVSKDTAIEQLTIKDVFMKLCEHLIIFLYFKVSLWIKKWHCFVFAFELRVCKCMFMSVSVCECMWVCVSVCESVCMFICKCVRTANEFWFDMHTNGFLTQHEDNYVQLLKKMYIK